MNYKIECPYCDGFAALQKHPRDITYRKEVFKVMEHFYKCEKCEEEFTTTEADTITLLQAHNQYREKYKIPFPEEITAIKDKYELSATKMSEVLGLGANGYSNYEKGEMPSTAIGNLIRAAANPRFFIELLERAKDHFTKSAFSKTCEKVEYLIQKERNGEPFYAALNIYNDPNNFTGYRKINSGKISSLLSAFITRCKEEFNDKLKLNKLFFYTDFCHYKNNGISISGLSYRAISYGPVPANYDNIFTYFENEQIITSNWTKGPNGSAKEVFTTTAEFEANLFTEDELKTVDFIIDQFRDISSWGIVELSHQERAWKELEGDRKLISYQEYAFDLQGA